MHCEFSRQDYTVCSISQTYFLKNYLVKLIFYGAIFGDSELLRRTKIINYQKENRVEFSREKEYLVLSVLYLSPPLSQKPELFLFEKVS